MVSFSCEACGDVLTKKKLDQHRNQCRGASFTCLDCMVHFRSTDYRSHTSCVTEDQKYQGALYKPKQSKAEKRKSVTIADPKKSGALVARAAYVEDAPDADAGIPPAAPTPPPAASAQPVQPAPSVNVFDFLVAEKSPNMSKVSLGGSQEQMTMKREAQSIFSQTNQPNHTIENASGPGGGWNETYEEHGFSYGVEPVRPGKESDPSGSLVSFEFMTPAAKATKPRQEQVESATHSRTNSGTTIEKKRKRGSPEALDLSTVHAKGNRRRQQPDDTPMVDAPPSSADTPSLAHSGLTGGLNRLLSDPPHPFPPTPEYSDEKEEAREMERKNRHSRVTEHPASPLKRSRQSKEDHSVAPSASGLSIKGRAGRIISMVGTSSSSSSGRGFSVLNPAGLQNKETALVRTKRRSHSPDNQGHTSREGRKMEKRKAKLQRAGSVLSSSRHDPWSYGADERASSITSNTGRRRRGSNESPESRRRKVKAIQYHYPRKADDDVSASDSDSDVHHSRPAQHHRTNTTTAHSRPRGGARGGSNNNDAEMILYRPQDEAERLQLRAESFLSYVTKGPDSSRGCSVNKALKRWHRDGAGVDVAATATAAVAAAAATSERVSREEEQKELWKALRLRRNDRGEIVVVF